MKAIEFTSTKIHCDECGHEFQGEPQDWHNKTCPECGKGVLVNDHDLATWLAISSLSEAVNAILGDLPDDTPTGTVSFSTAPSTAR